MRFTEITYLPFLLLRIVCLVRVLGAALPCLDECTSAVGEKLDVESCATFSYTVSCSRGRARTQEVLHNREESGRDIEQGEGGPEGGRYLDAGRYSPVP